MKVLVLLESPSKIEKIKHYLEESFPENQFVVLASGGHINSIADKGAWGLGIDLETMQPDFVIDSSRKKIISQIKKEGKTADLIILASDPDREGEAIAYHLANLFKDHTNIKRITFNEITSEAITNAFNNLRDIDMNLVNAQISRQILDKIIGYLVSKSLQKSTGLMSAGRVQTPALNILTTRDTLIKNFKEVLYKNIFVIESKRAINLSLVKDKNNVLVNTEKTYYIDEKQAKTIVVELGEVYRCTDYKSTAYETRSFKPYSTAGLLQDGFTKLKLSTSQITLAAQKLYELGYITYIRTDSVKYSSQFISEVKDYISKNYSSDLFKAPVVGKKDQNSQEAHESIRPTNIWLTPEKASLEIEDNLLKRVYNLIWWNSIKSLMKGPSGFNHRWTFNNNGYEFKQSWQEVKDLGYQAIKNSSSDENIELTDDGEEVVKTKDPKPEYQFNDDFEINVSKKYIKIEDAKTNPPKMFNQASLIKELKNLGIGRPSTYNPILTKLKDREYVEFPKSKPIVVTTKGYSANQYLYDHYLDFFNLNYTAEMEEKLDEITKGSFDYVNWLKEIYNALNIKVKKEIGEAKTEAICPRCGANLVYIKSRFNRGRGCSNFTKTKCGYREYEQPDGTWKEYVKEKKPQEETSTETKSTKKTKTKKDNK
ncbi:type IA DNA topoisomerase [Mycoplasma mycoides]|uniref:type IA DNA topoisomerase n=1 Tax=Mycoplasma mycoides TaxID=2102 RepID=UPI0027375F8C|nr:DNA topoisomerase [Mycoplasma mycoides]MDP4040262.1 DNA topoisomerase [Mycoplasma mycoides]MDP4041128.1 DNA topoisomerase [Mycoplasma mycoides]MDP4042080.1 DNA topoisomerase [Mycoplasma mycoides]MDP4043482.1 DNA topoisomerase [Mycoplasma mycoides]MDP4044331.1 DNA topoisomerase [Mycoplasma mycoides]